MIICLRGTRVTQHHVTVFNFSMKQNRSISKPIFIEIQERACVRLSSSKQQITSATFSH